MSSFKDPYALAVLAAASAEAGRFQDAVDTAKWALQLAHAEQSEALVKRIGDELALYQEHKPCRHSGSSLLRMQRPDLAN